MSGSWREHPAWKEADAIYQRWRNEEFDIDAEKAKKLHYALELETESEHKLLGGGKSKVEETRRGSVLDILMACLGDWVMRRESSSWVDSARELIQSYTLARGNGVLIAGLSIRRDIQQRERQIADLSAELQEKKGKLADLDKRLFACGERVKELEIENQKLRERNPVFGVTQGTVDDLGEDASKKDDEE